jgi:UDP-2-acetamido-2,6-beta-L-arabino-hexul-4-ose reductase
MNILVTGSNGFVGKNLIAYLDTKNEHKIIRFDRNASTLEQINLIQSTDLIIHLAGVMRPVNREDFSSGNVNFTEFIVKTLIELNKETPIVFTSSVHSGRHSDYGFSKKAAENLLIEYSNKFNTSLTIFRLPHLYGKWSKPNYNSVVATFCYNLAHEIPLVINDENPEIGLLYIDDLVKLIYSNITHYEEGITIVDEFDNIQNIRINDLANKLSSISRMNRSSLVPNLENDFDKKLFSTYTSFLSPEKLVISKKINETIGSRFIELLKSEYFGQVSVNVIYPGVTKGNHWHQTKHEKYSVICGQALIRLRKKYSNEIIEIKIDSNSLEIIDIPPGVVHCIKNIGRDDLVTIMWANEIYNRDNPDTFSEDV